MVLSMLRSFGKIGPQIDQIWAWLSRGHRWSPGVRNPLKSSVTGPSLLVNCYLEIKFHKIIRVNPPPPLIVNFVPFLPIFGISLRLKIEVQKFSYSYFTVVFSSVRWSYKPSFKKFLIANFELNDLIVNFVPFLPIFGIYLRLKR